MATWGIERFFFVLCAYPVDFEHFCQILEYNSKHEGFYKCIYKTIYTVLVCSTEGYSIEGYNHVTVQDTVIIQGNY